MTGPGAGAIRPIEARALQLLHLAAFPPSDNDPQFGFLLQGEPNELTRMVAAEGFIEVEIHRGDGIEPHHRIRITPLGLAAFYMHHPLRRPGAVIVDGGAPAPATGADTK